MTYTKKNLKNTNHMVTHFESIHKSGFSLVELIVVVAIIGVLASIVVPNYGKLVYRARATESKTQLAGIYTAERGFYAEYAAYHTSFSAIGYAPEGSLRFNVGFGAPSAAGDEAGPANGYTTPLSPLARATVNTLGYCSNALGVGGFAGNNCRMLNGYFGNLPGALSGGFTVYPDDFLAGATIDAPAEYVALNEDQEIELLTPELKRLRSMDLRGLSIATLLVPQLTLPSVALASSSGVRQQIVQGISSKKVWFENHCQTSTMSVGAATSSRIPYQLLRIPVAATATEPATIRIAIYCL